MTITSQLSARAGSVRLVDVSKAYDERRSDQKAVDSINLEIEAGTFVTLLGPSGCGKTTTLRMIAGFEQPTSGDILLDGATVVSVAPEKRPMSMVFQSYALFPHLTVSDNVGFGLKLKKLERAARQQKVEESLRMMGIEQYADRYPHQLSGGQQQRVALARALAMEPRIVLFDEPLSNLDARLRVRMREEIRSLQQRLGLTAIFVTHDQSEALTMSDLVVVMSAGRIEQFGSPVEVYRHPANRFVASFLGTSNFIDGTVAEVLSDDGNNPLYRLQTEVGTFDVPGTSGLTVGAAASLVVRAEDLHVVDVGSGIPATVSAVAFDGGVVNYSVETAVGRLQGQASGAEPMHERDSAVGLAVQPRSLWVIPYAEDSH